MNLKPVLHIIVVASVVAFLGLAGWILLAEPESSSDLRRATSLLSPPQALAAQHTFLHDHAGITAYARVQWQDGVPDWERLVSRLTGVKNSGPRFIVGVLDGRRGDGAEDDPHVLLHEDGWIASYFPADQHAARIICHQVKAWNTYGVSSQSCYSGSERATNALVPRPAIFDKYKEGYN